MKILLCAATEMEIAPTLAYLATRLNTQVDVVLTGVGLMAATHAITKATLLKKPDMLIQAGIAGSLDPSLSLGDVVAVKSDCVGDLGVWEEQNFQSVFAMNFTAANVHPWTAGKLLNKNEKLLNLNLPIVDAVTVNEITTDPEVSRYYQSVLHARVESMEGAALHYIGLMENIPFLQLRSLSNFIGERDKTKWKMTEAINNLNNVLLPLLAKLTTS